ncbi:MAG: tetratricopeptide repeat protein [bacterium]|nr:tetratricopeptide repeat protein [bacterium]
MLNLIRILLAKIASYFGPAGHTAAASTTEEDELDAEIDAEIAEQERAMDEANHTIAKYPQKASGYLKRGRLYLDFTDGYASAMPDLDKAVELDPENAEAWATRGLAFLTYYWNDTNEAHLNFARAMQVLSRKFPIRLQPLATDEKSPSQLDLIVRRATRDIRRKKNVSAALTNRSWAHWAAAKYKLACRDIEEAIHQDPANPDAYLLRAEFQQVLDDLKIDVEKAYSLDPSRPEGYTTLANHYYRFGSCNEGCALEAADKALSIRANFAPAHFIRGKILVGLGRMHEAISAFRETVYLDPSHAVGHKHLAECLENLGQIPEALDEYWKFIASADKVDVAQIIETIVHVEKLPGALESRQRFIADEVPKQLLPKTNKVDTSTDEHHYVEIQHKIEAPAEALDWLEKKLSGEFDKNNSEWPRVTFEFERIEGAPTAMYFYSMDPSDCDEALLVDAICEMQKLFNLTIPSVLTVPYFTDSSYAEYHVEWVVCYRGICTYLDPTEYLNGCIEKLVKELDADADDAGEARS